MIVFPNCKINLGLHILNKRPDGYHNLDTLFYPIPLCDSLELVEHKEGKHAGAQITLEGIPVEGDQKNNLVLKAYDLLHTDYALPPVDFCLLKNIPMGAGLGGGSSDGAFAIHLLNQYFKLQIPLKKQIDFAAQLGSDCAFFLHNKACLGTGRGEILEPIPFSLKGYWIALVKPPIHIGTAEAFSKIIPRDNNPQATKSAIKDIIQLPVKEWSTLLVNDFEGSVFPSHPILVQTKEKLYQLGAEYAAMSGSGSTIFGLFKEAPKLKNHFSEFFYFECELS